MVAQQGSDVMTASCDDSGNMDLVMQTSSQSMAYRLAEYYNDPSIPLFPSPEHRGKARELGQHNTSHGPCLTIVEQLSCTPQAHLSWFRTALLRRQVSRLMWFPSNGPKFSNRQEMLADMVSHGPPDGSIRLVCYPKDLQDFLLESLPPEWQLHPRSHSHVIMALDIEGTCRWYMLPEEHVYCKSSTAPAHFKGSVATAVSKLHEALHVCGIPAPEQLGNVIDLGAAPGAWTSYLAQHARLVIAVDPAHLSESALAPNVVHLKKRAQEAVDEIHQLLGGQQADLLTCDMNTHPAEVNEIVKTLLVCLKPGGYLVLTLKFTGVGRKRHGGSHQNIAFQEWMEPGKCIWLLANTVNERTYIARRRLMDSQPETAPTV